MAGRAGRMLLESQRKSAEPCFECTQHLECGCSDLDADPIAGQYRDAE
jgi:hypothetical protein